MRLDMSRARGAIRKRSCYRTTAGGTVTHRKKIRKKVKKILTLTRQCSKLQEMREIDEQKEYSI